MNTQLLVLKTVNPFEWDSKVTLLGGSGFHSHSMIEYSSLVTGGEPLFIEYTDPSIGECIGLAGGIITKSNLWPFSKHARTAIFESLPITKDNNKFETILLNRIEKKLKEIGVFKISFASYDSINRDNILNEAMYKISNRYEFEFDLKMDIETIFSSISSTKRKHYRKSIKNGVQTRESKKFKSIGLVEQFREDVMNRRDLMPSKNVKCRFAASRKLFDAGRLRVLVSTLCDKPVGACAFLVFNKKVYALRSGSSHLGNQHYSPVNLYWKAINLFKREGFDVLNLGGAKEGEPGIRQFKQMLGAKESYQPSGYKILSDFGSNIDNLRKLISLIRSKI